MLDSLHLYYLQVNQYALLTKQEEQKLFKQLAQTKVDSDAYWSIYQKIYLANLRLALTYARTFYHTNAGLPLLDLIQEANIGLDKAIKHFDYTKNFKFSTYATSWIKQSLHLAIEKTGRTVRLPQQMELLNYRMLKLIADYRAKTNHTLKTADLAEKLHTSEFNIKRLKMFNKHLKSLDLEVNDPYHQENTGTTKGDLIKDDHVNLEQQLLIKDAEHALSDKMAQLKPQMQFIIINRYGLYGHPRLTLEQCGLHLNLSKERIRQLQKKALILLSHTSLKDYLDVYN